MQLLVERGQGRDDRTISIDEVVLALGDLDPTPELIERVRATLATASVDPRRQRVPTSVPLTDEVLTAAPVSPDEEVVVVVRDPALDDGDDLVERRHRARFRTATREHASSTPRPAAPPTRCACT